MAHEELVNVEFITARRFRSVDSSCGCGAGRVVAGERCCSIIYTRFKVKTDQIGVRITLAESVIRRHLWLLI